MGRRAWRGVTGFKEGDAVASTVRGAAAGATPASSRWNTTVRTGPQIKGFGGGLGLDGGMAEYMLVPSARLVVPLGDLSPAKAAPLSDAALRRTTRSNGRCHTSIRPAPSSSSASAVSDTWPFNSCACSLPSASSPPMLMTTSSARQSARRRRLVNNRNASDAAERIQPITGARGAGLVLDCVGVQPTLDLGAKLLGRNSAWTIVD